MPNYILKMHDAMLIPRNKSVFLYYFKGIAWLSIVPIIALFVLSESVNYIVVISWLVVIICLSIITKTDRQPYPLEIRFYDDYLVLYWEKYFYNVKRTVEQITKIYYKDITKCNYILESGRFEIFGLIDMTWYEYNKDGSLPDLPTYHVSADGGISYFYNIFDEGLDIVSEIESHSPIKVHVSKTFAG